MLIFFPALSFTLKRAGIHRENAQSPAHLVLQSFLLIIPAVPILVNIQFPHSHYAVENFIFDLQSKGLSTRPLGCNTKSVGANLEINAVCTVYASLSGLCFCTFVKAINYFSVGAHNSLFNFVWVCVS